MIIVAGGASSRFGGDKLMTPIDGLPLVLHTVAAVSGSVDRCVLVCRDDQIEWLTAVDADVVVVPGGKSRTGSELAGLAEIDEEVELTGIHDGARPLVGADLIERLFAMAAVVGGAIPVLEPTAPLLRSSDLAPVPGARLAQTPQVFRTRPLVAAYRRAFDEGFEGHDTADVVQAFSDLTIAAVDGDPDNLKVTYPADLDVVRRTLDTSRNGPR